MFGQPATKEQFTSSSEFINITNSENVKSNFDMIVHVISKMQSGREDTLEERYAIRLCFKLGKNAKEMYGMLQTTFWPSCMNQASVFWVA